MRRHAWLALVAVVCAAVGPIADETSGAWRAAALSALIGVVVALARRLP